MKKGSKLPFRLKGLFFVLRGDRFVPIKAVNFLGHIAELSKWISLNKAKCKNDFFTKNEIR